MWKQLLICLLSLAPASFAAEWPKESVIAEESASPDGSYAVLIPPQEAGDEDDEKLIDYLADVRAHRVLGAIQGAHYCEHRNHSGLSVHWSADSTWGVVEFSGRFSFAAITLLEIERDRLTQTDLGKHLEKATPGFANGDFFVRLSPARKLRARVLSTSDPKGMHPEGATWGLFQGTYDLASHRWTVEDGRKISAEQYDALERAYVPLDDNITRDSALANKLSYLDEELNFAYSALRLLLPAERFARIKAEQIAWLKQRDAASSDLAKASLLHDRVVHLKDLLW